MPKTKSLTLQALGVGATAGVAISPIVTPLDYGATKAKEKVELHGIDQMRLAIEERKVNDLHSLVKTVAK